MSDPVVGKIEFGANDPARELAQALQRHPHGAPSASEVQQTEMLRLLRQNNDLLAKVVDELKLIKREINLKRSI